MDRCFKAVKSLHKDEENHAGREAVRYHTSAFHPMSSRQRVTSSNKPLSNPEENSAVSAAEMIRFGNRSSHTPSSTHYQAWPVLALLEYVQQRSGGCQNIKLVSEAKHTVPY